MHDDRRYFSEDERRGWRGREERRDRPYDDRGESRWFHRDSDPDRERGGAEGSWRDQGDGGYFEPSRGRWDDDRRYTRSRQDQYEGGSQRHWSGGLGGFGGSYGRGAGQYSAGNRGYRSFDRRADEPWSNDRGQGWGGASREHGSSWETGRQSYAGRGPKDYRRSDERIREEISDRLTDDPRVDASDITVEVTSGEVTLNGTVSDRDQKRRAEDLAEAVSGVREVVNHLRVSRSDQDRASGHESSAGTSTSGNKPKSGSRLP